MKPASHRRRLIINADDFGRSAAINQAVIRGCQEGVLTTASLMVNEPAAAEAVALARETPSLGVGLHLTLLCGTPALSPREIPGLLDRRGRFTDSPLTAGFRYWFHKSLEMPLRAEIRAQFARFKKTGMELDHVNGHLHLHLHPTILRILIEEAETFGLKRIRLTCDPFWLNLRLARGRWVYRVLHAAVFHSLSAAARPIIRPLRLKHPRFVFGLLQDGRVDETYVLNLMERLPAGDSELYSHPSVDEPQAELKALLSPRVRNRIEELGIERIRYQDL